VIRLRLIGAAALATLLAPGCGTDTPLAPPSAHLGLVVPGSPLPALGDGKTSGEFFQVCKYGSNAGFSYTVTNNVTHVSTTSTINVNDGECWVLVANTNATVSITETSAAAGYQLDHVVLETSLGSPAVMQPPVTSSGPTVSALIGGGSLGLPGATAKFYNVITPPPPSGSIGDFVWNDLNGNGVQDAGEPGLAGLTVMLGGAASATTTTDASGGYQFTGLSAGNYSVTVGTPAGFTASPSNQGGDPLKDSNGSPASVTLATNSSSDQSIDFGFVPIPTPPSGQIGDYVWEDENGDGIQDATEPGMPGITVTLAGPINATTTTDANGGYLFTDLPAGSYTVTVATPSGFTASPSNQGGDPLDDSNGSPASVTLPTNSSVNLSIDFGFVPPRGVGRMTGGGQQFDINGVRISRGLTLHCDIALSNNLEINWPGSNGTNNFHITRPLTSAVCILDPAYRQPPPRAPFNTFIGVAQGTLNGIPGATAYFTFIDAGEPGHNDKTQIRITDASGAVVLDVPLGNLAHGNIQAHYDQPHGNKP